MKMRIMGIREHITEKTEQRKFRFSERMIQIMKMKKTTPAIVADDITLFDRLISQAKKGAVFFDWYQMEEEQNGIHRNFDVVIQRI